MPLLKDQKIDLAKVYSGEVDAAGNTVVLSFEGIPVNQINKVRMDLHDANGQLKIVKKRVFLKSVEGKLEGLTLDQIPGAIAVLHSHNEEDEHAPLKVIHKHTKLWKKEKLECTMDYVGGWYESVWKDKTYVAELAALPSKEELLSKFLFMLNHPVSSFARALKAIADKDSSEVESEEVTPEAAAPEAEVKEEASEEKAKEQTEEAAE